MGKIAKLGNVNDLPRCRVPLNCPILIPTYRHTPSDIFILYVPHLYLYLFHANPAVKDENVALAAEHHRMYDKQNPPVSTSLDLFNEDLYAAMDSAGKQ